MAHHSTKRRRGTALRRSRPGPLRRRRRADRRGRRRGGRGRGRHRLPPPRAGRRAPARAADNDRSTVKAQIAALYRQADQLTQTYDAAQEQAAKLSQAVRALAVHAAAHAGGLPASARDDRRDRGGPVPRRRHGPAPGPDARGPPRHLPEQRGHGGPPLRRAAPQDRRGRGGAPAIVQLQHAAADQISAPEPDPRLGGADPHAGERRTPQGPGAADRLSAPQRQRWSQADLGADPNSSFTGEQTDPATLDQTALPPRDRARAAIDAAIADLGKPYVFGAEGPDAFDCSGLIQRVWRQAGVELPRTSSEQAQAGQQVPLSQIQPGDLVIYYAGRSHIGMYVGDGKIIHAPHPGAQVRYAPLMSMPVKWWCGFEVPAAIVANRPAVQAGAYVSRGFHVLNARRRLSSTALNRVSKALKALPRQASPIRAAASSGKISSSPRSRPSKMRVATDVGEDFGTSLPAVMSVSTMPTIAAWTRTPVVRQLSAQALGQREGCGLGHRIARQERQVHPRRRGQDVEHAALAIPAAPAGMPWSRRRPRRSSPRSAAPAGRGRSSRRRAVPGPRC